MSGNSARHLVITVHGIRTFGGWQEELEKIIKKTDHSRNITFAHYKYGYFSVIAFIIPIFRWIVVRRFRKVLRIYIKETFDRVDLVGHSFGTHLIAWALRGLGDKEPIKIHTVILSGSVLRSSFPWNEMLGQKVKRLVNDCGSKDNVLLLSQFWVLFTGMAGRVGLAGLSDENFKNRYSVFGHGGYFTNGNGALDNTYMEKNWLPIIVSNDGIEGFDNRQQLTSLEGILITLGNNAEPIKMIMYTAPLIALALWLYQQRNDAIAAALMAQFRTGEFINSSSSARLLPLAVAAARLSSGLEATRLAERELRQSARRVAVTKTSVGVPLEVASPNSGNLIAVMGANTGLELFSWESSDPSKFETRQLDSRLINSDYNHDGDYYTVVSESSIELIEIENMSNRRAINSKSDSGSVVSSFGGNHIAQWDDENNLWVYDTQNNSTLDGSPFRIETLCGQGSIHRMLISDDGKTAFVMMSQNKADSICQLNIVNGSAKVIAIRPDMREMAISRDGKRLALAVMGSIVYIDENGSHHQINRDPKYWNSSITFSRDDRFIGYVSNNSVTVWDTDTKRALANLTSEMTVFDISFARDGQMLLVGGSAEDGKSAVEIWDLMAAEAYTQARRWPRSDVSLLAVRNDESMIFHDLTEREIIVQSDYDDYRKVIQLKENESGVVYDQLSDVIFIFGESISRIIELSRFSELSVPPNLKDLTLELVIGDGILPIFIGHKEGDTKFEVWSAAGSLIARDLMFDPRAEGVTFIDGGRHMVSMIRASLEDHQILSVVSTVDKTSFDIVIKSPFWNIETTKDGLMVVGDGEHVYLYDLRKQRLIRSHKLPVKDSFRLDASGKYLYGCMGSHLSAIDVHLGKLISQSELGKDCAEDFSIKISQKAVYVKSEKLQRFDLTNSSVLKRACDRMHAESAVDLVVEAGNRIIDVCPSYKLRHMIDFLGRFVSNFLNK